jgi:hypothetical protein
MQGSAAAAAAAAAGGGGLDFAASPFRHVTSVKFLTACHIV